MMKQDTSAYTCFRQFMSGDLYHYLVAVLQKYDVAIKITRPRKTKFGDYRALPGNRYQITINSNLNRYSFIITLLHEVAHLLAFHQYGRSVKPHGTEWKQEFSRLLEKALGIEEFPQDVETALQQHINRPKAGGCSDYHLTKVLLKYDEEEGNSILLEELRGTEIFKTTNGRVFKKVAKMRKRYRCVELETNRLYSFSPFARIVPVKL